MAFRIIPGGTPPIPLDMSFHAMSSDTITTVAITSGASAGDFVVLTAVVNGGNMPAPTGFTTSYSATVSSTTRVWIGWRVLASTTTVSIPSGSLGQAWGWTSYTPNKAISNVYTYNGTAIATDANPAAYSLGGVIAGPVVYGACLATNINTVSPRTWSGFTEQSPVGTWFWHARRLWTLGSNSAAVSIDMDDEASGNRVACAAYYFD